MLPSDHFVRFYNEVFKYLDERNGLEDYYKAISADQETHCLKLFSEKGLKGVYEYYVRIYREENCVGELNFDGQELYLTMDKCPSLSKAMDNDAGVCKKYCLHCPGWSMPIYTKAGLFEINDLMGLDNPQCREWLYEDVELARAKYRSLLETNKKEQFLINFEP